MLLNIELWEKRNERKLESLLQLTTLEMLQVERNSLHMSNLELSAKGQGDRIQHH